MACQTGQSGQCPPNGAKPRALGIQPISTSATVSSSVHESVFLRGQDFAFTILRMQEFTAIESVRVARVVVVVVVVVLQSSM